MNTNRLAYLRILLPIIAILNGCTAINTLPTAARSGDSITIALGSQEGMKRNNTTATFTPDSTGVSVTLTPKAIFNLYPDKRSKLYRYDQGIATQLVEGTSHEQWITVMAVDLPAGLPTGYGTINVSTTVPQASIPNALVQNVSYRLEILPGIGAPHDLKYLKSDGNILGGTIGHLQRINNQTYIDPPTISSCSQAYPQGYGAIELRLQLPFVIEPYADTDWFTVIADDLTAYTNQKIPQMTWSATGDELSILFMSADGELRCFEPKFSITPRYDGIFSASSQPVLLSVDYYDVNGAVAVGPALTEYQLNVR